MSRFMTALAAATMLCSGAAHAGLTFDTVTGASPVGASGATDQSDLLGQTFFLGSAVDFNSISVVLSDTATNDSGSIVVLLAPVTTSGQATLGAAVAIGTIDASTLTTTPTAVTVVPDSPTLTATSFANPFSASPPANGEYYLLLNLSNTTGDETGPNSTDGINWSYNAADTGVNSEGQFSYSDAAGAYNDATGGTPPGAFELQVDAPEPASIAILGAAMAGLGYVRRRVAKKA